MNFVPPDTCLQDYKKRRRAFLKHLIASTPNVSVRAKEFRRWIDENSPYSDAEAWKSAHRPTFGKARWSHDIVPIIENLGLKPVEAARGKATMHPADQ
jgi:hypothetical protein